MIQTLLKKGWNLKAKKWAESKQTWNKEACQLICPTLADTKTNQNNTIMSCTLGTVESLQNWNPTKPSKKMKSLMKNRTEPQISINSSTRHYQ